MRYLFLLVVLGSFHVSFGQQTIIETGRPKPYVIRNAQEIAGKKFKVKYVYVAYRSDKEQLDSISKNNEKTYAFLAKKYGDDWKRQLDNAVKNELENFGTFMGMMKKNNAINDDNLVHFSKSNCGDKYVAEVYPAIEPENRSSQNLIKKITFQIKDGKAVMK